MRALEDSAERCRRVLRPRSVAVVGASPNPERLNGRLVRNLIAGGFEGPVYPVNPRYEMVMGLTASPSVSAVGKPIDLALIMLSAEASLAALEDCVAAGVPAARVFASGFAEAGPDGTRRQAALSALADRVAIAGPNCNGLLSRPANAALGFAPYLEHPSQDGPRAIISQSGGLTTTLAMRAAARSIGFRYAIATGNEAQIGVEDYLAYLATEDDPVDSCVLLLETIRNLPAFVRAAVACRDRGIRLIAMKIGRSTQGSAMSASHTAALAGDPAIYVGLFDMLGIWSVDRLDQLVLCTQFDYWQDRPGREGVGFVTLSGGLAVNAADAAELASVPLARFSEQTSRTVRDATGAAAQATISNPFDCGGGLAVNDPSRWNRTLDALTGQEDIDAVIAMLCTTGGDSDRSLVDGIVRQRRRGANFGVVWTTAESVPGTIAAMTGADVPLFDTVEDAIDCLAVRQRSRSRPDTPNELVDRYLTSTSSLAAGGEVGIAQVLRATGVEVPGQVECWSVEEAVSAFHTLGETVAIKTTSTLHKSESAGVVLGVTTATAVRQAAGEIARRLGYPILIQQQVSGVRELMVGCTRTALGVAVVLGAGGVLAEYQLDTLTLLAPIDYELASWAWQQLKLSQLLRGFRHLQPTSIDRLARLVSAIGELALARADVRAIDLNPLIVSDDGTRLYAVDVAVEECNAQYNQQPREPLDRASPPHHVA
jgi:acyl-CoA synthetase (NDP forming)